MIFVTNNNDFEHQDRYAGTDYYWEPGEKVAISEEAAAHMFGFGRKDKTENLVRLGWNWNEQEGIKRLAKFVFTQAQMVEVSEIEEVKAA